jgi:glycosyltransferase involved in cell wall biosynthesis
MIKTLAILSPNQSAYSETFIQAHKKLPFNIRFYYGGSIPSSLEGNDSILKLSHLERIKRRLFKEFTFEEKRLLFSLRKEKVDCVLTEYGTTAADCLKVIQFLKLPLVVHFHGFDASVKTVIEQYKEKYKAVFQYATKVIVVSKKMQETLLKLECPKEKLMLNCCGPDDSFFTVQPTFHNPQFLSVGRFVSKKAPHLTIFAFRKVVDINPDAKLIMVGEGELLNICKAFANLLGLENNIEFKGVCSPIRIKALFQDSIAFLQHSIIGENGDSEGMPVAILEAQAAGLPVISTYHAGIPDVVIHNQTGLLVEEGDVDGMAENMMKILQEKDLAKKLGEGGRKRIAENFTLEEHLNRLSNEISKANSIYSKRTFK